MHADTGTLTFPSMAGSAAPGTAVKVIHGAVVHVVDPSVVAIINQRIRQINMIPNSSISGKQNLFTAVGESFRGSQGNDQGVGAAGCEVLQIRDGAAVMNCGHDAGSSE